MSVIPGLGGIAGMAGPALNGEFVGVWATTGSATVAQWPAGTVEGDLGIVFTHEYATTTIDLTTGGWTIATARKALGGTAEGKVFYKILTASDITTPPTMTGSGIRNISSAVYRGVTTITEVAHLGKQTGTTLVFGGVTKPAGCQFLHGWTVDRDPSANCTPPAGWTDDGKVSGTYLSQNNAHIAAADYNNGDAITFTAFGGTYQQGGWILSIK